MQRERRATAGRRLTALVGEAQEADSAFWGHSTWADAPSDGDEADSDYGESDFEALEEEEKDIFDEDFNDSSSDDEEEEEEEDEEDDVGGGIGTGRKRKRGQRRGARGGHGVYKEPYRKQQRRRRQEGELPRGQRTEEEKAALRLAGAHRAVRASTKRQTQVTNAAVEKGKEGNAARRRKRQPGSGPGAGVGSGAAPGDGEDGAAARVLQIKMAQEEYIKEGVKTEQENLIWLCSMQRLGDEADAKKKKNAAKSMRGARDIHFHSRRGSQITVTFPSVEAMPKVLRHTTAAATTRKSTCVITGRPARYRDPRTGLPYADLEAFKALRKRYGSGTGKHSSLRAASSFSSSSAAAAAAVAASTASR